MSTAMHLLLATIEELQTWSEQRIKTRSTTMFARWALISRLFPMINVPASSLAACSIASRTTPPTRCWMSTSSPSPSKMKQLLSTRRPRPQMMLWPQHISSQKLPNGISTWQWCSRKLYQFERTPRVRQETTEKRHAFISFAQKLNLFIGYQIWPVTVDVGSRSG